MKRVYILSFDEVMLNQLKDLGKDVNIRSFISKMLDTWGTSTAQKLQEQAKKIVAAFLSTAFYNEEKYVRRLKKIKDRETVRQ